MDGTLAGTFDIQYAPVGVVEADIADAIFLASGNGRDEEQADTWAE
jgi:hypothetical protein